MEGSRGVVNGCGCVWVGQLAGTSALKDEGGREREEIGIDLGET